MNIKTITNFLVAFSGGVMLSCNSSTLKKNQCFNNQVGAYSIDVKKTISESGSLGIYQREYLENFRIVFEADSTFRMNKRVDFFSDTIGKWSPGNCDAFENSGVLSYFNNQSKEQFGVCQQSDTFFTKMLPYHKEFGSITLWFKKDIK